MSAAKLEALRNGVQTNDNVLEVEVDPQRPLERRTHTFQLQVVDEAGNKSAVATVTVTVQDSEIPTAVLTILDSRGGELRREGDAFILPLGASFILSGEGSSDPRGGRIREYHWSLRR